jgi:hypothetical protein
MTTLKKIIKVLSSKELLLWMAGVWVVYYVTLAVVASEAFGRFVKAMNVSAAARVPYVIFIVCLALNIARVFGQRRKDSRVRAALGAILPIGLMVFLTGFLLSASYRHFMWVQVGEGQVVRPPWSDRALEVGPISPALERKTLQAEEEGLIFAFEPKVKLSDGRSLYTVGAFPPSKIGDSYYHILDFGLAPGVRLESEGRVVDEGYVMLRILPPGVLDSFELRPAPYVFTVHIAPKEIKQKGDTRMKLYDLDSLAYEVEARRGDTTVFEGRTSGGAVAFDGAKLTFSKPTYWVMLDIAKDHGRPVILAGIALLALGLPLWLVSIFLGRKHRAA